MTHSGKQFIIANKLIVAAFILGTLSLGFPAGTADAAVNNWQKGVSLYPKSNNDFASATFKESLKNAAAMNANTATFIVPYYQSAHTTSDIQSGWNTPTDQSLIEGIAFAQSLGMNAAIKIHLSSYQGDAWAAKINATDRNAWFKAYGTIVSRYAKLAEEQKVSQIVIGNELALMSDSRAHPQNTANWTKLIKQTRKQFSGSLTYNANWGGCDICNEKANIAFWNKLDAIGVSAYNPLEEDREASWKKWNKTEIKPLSKKYKKPVLFTEVGYRNITDSRMDSWNYVRDGAIDMDEQADNFEELFAYWNTQPHMAGLNIWGWDTNPNAGGPNNKDFTVHNKPAQETIRKWFKSDNFHYGTVRLTYP
jgi:hypothetical protein